MYTALDVFRKMSIENVIYLPSETRCGHDGGLEYLNGARVRTRDNVEDVVATWLVVAVVAWRAWVEVYCAKWFHGAILKIRKSMPRGIHKITSGKCPYCTCGDPSAQIWLGHSMA